MAAERYPSVVPDPEPEEAYDALLDLLAEDGEAAARWERACRRHVIVPDGEVLALRSALSRRGHRHTYGDVEAALYALALEEVPGSWAASRERLHRRVRGRDADGARSETPATAVEHLMATETVWLRELWLLAEDAPDYARLREVSSRVWVALRRRCRDYPPEHFSEHLHEVLCAVFPHAPGAAWDGAWADGLLRRAVAYVGERAAPSSYLGAATATLTRAEVELGEALHSRDRRRYRRAVHGWVAVVVAASRVAFATPSPPRGKPFVSSAP